MTVQILHGDCRETMAKLLGQSVHCCVTSPPYFGLRDYGHPDQIGLEATPDEFIANLIDVFREVYRVLRDDGTLWLNMGDTYAGSRAGGQQDGTLSGAQPVHSKLAKQTHQAFTEDQKAASAGAKQRMTASSRRDDEPISRSDVKVAGLKAKDLMGIPWRLALALQQPYYAGRIKDEGARIWLAAMIDGEGCFFIHKRKAGTPAYSSFTRANGTVANYARTTDTFGVGLEICNTSKPIIDRVQAIVGGTVTTQGQEQNARRKQTIYRLRVAPNEAKRIAQEVYPHLVGKQHQARLIFNCPSTGEAGAAAHQAMMDLHNGVATVVDYPALPSLFEPGWYLRQDIIWAKPNPLPESVTDRCTKSHEYIFLLSKAPQYFFDQASIAEPIALGSVARLSQDVENQAGSDRVPGKTNGPMKAVIGKSGNLERKPGTARGCHEGTGSNVNGSVPWEGVTRNKRSVWTVSTKPFKGLHFATFPPDLIEPCIKAGCPEGGVVLDCFGGSGTTGLVADRLGRNAILCELSQDYIGIAERRLAGDAGHVGRQISMGDGF